ncbi:MAG: efflux RND transporter permease subunit [Xanthomonadales bacterium]|nr:efflux RND transporter permease subunit [Xanthomonadales bacterium]ODU74338.1 MAG: cation transporter [Rhodanobacter sp. SCN 69-32]OJY84134.1 MAG: cation transporter [Xanthomonadales bacterium 66-474]
MIARLIRWSIGNRFLVLIGALALAIIGTISLLRTPLEALPDLSDTQVIIRTTWPGRSPQLVQQQVTYPLTTLMMSVPGATTVRGYSFFGDSFVYVLFADGTDLYWARSRVLEYLSQARGKLPEGVVPTLGPDATGVGWIYEYALVDRTGQHDLGQLRTLQDWFLRYRLKTVPNVAEVASVGGQVNAWQIVPDPARLAAHHLTIAQLSAAIRAANGASGGSVIEQGEADLMVNSEGYLRTREDFARIPVATGADGTPVLLQDVARIRRGPTLRTGIAELDGQGQVVGGVAVMRYGKNALRTIEAVKARLAELQKSLPAGVEIVPVYDQSRLIRASVNNVGEKLVEEFVVVALVCLLFLWHLRSSLVAVVTLPLGVLTAFIAMHAQGVSANLMSLGGIAIAIGAMVDAAVVMIENTHKHLETWQQQHEGKQPTSAERWRLVAEAMAEVGPALFFSLLVITFSFLPVFALQAQEGRLFKPLAFTKTYSMAAAAGLSVTLVPVLMGYLVRGHIRPEHANPINRALAAAYRPLLAWVQRWPKTMLLIATVVILTALVPLKFLGSQFMPPLDEGTLLYMPTALPNLSAGKAAQLLQLTDRMLKTVPEVAHVFGKAGRADTATDPAPLNMFETIVTFKPKDQWRPGMTMDKLKAELDHAVKVPGLTNLFVYPIRDREDMLATGIKSPIGIKVFGPDPAVLQKLANEIEAVARKVPDVRSVASDHVNSGRYVNVRIRRDAAARYGLTQQEVQSLIATVVGGDPIDETIEGLERFPVVLRYPRMERDTLSALQALPIVAPGGAQLTLGQVADLSVDSGPSMLKGEDGQLETDVYVDTGSSDLGGLVASLKHAIAEQVQLPTGYTLGWAGQFQYLQHAEQRLRLVVPLTLTIVFLLIWLIFRDVAEVAIVLFTVPAALAGGLWLVWLLGESVSVATVIGFISLAGVTAEFGVVMMLFLRQAWERRVVAGQVSEASLGEAIREGAQMRVRPIAMTVAVILAGLLPIMIGSGAGSDLVRSIATPMIGGMLVAPVLSMLAIPAAFRWLMLRRLRGQRTVAEALDGS